MKIKLPLKTKDIEKLKVGDIVYLTGDIYTARDAAHKKLISSDNMPLDLKNQTIYYVGPCPAPKDHIIGSAGPTTSARMDVFTKRLLELGLKGMIGKGPRSPEIVESIKEYKAIYFVTIGGAGAFLAEKIKEIVEVAYLDLGAESIKKLTVKEFPVIVAVDSRGDDLFA
jgi:fumarate hydratase subunit beta